MKIKTLICCAMLSLMASGSSGQAADKPLTELAMLGKWFCTVDGMVGLQGGKGEPRYRGKIKPRQKTFFLHIKKIKRKTIAETMYGKTMGADIHNERCFHPRRKANHLKFHRYEIGSSGAGASLSCWDRYKAEIKGEDPQQYWSSPNARMFRGAVLGGDFRISRSGSYTLSRARLGGFYLQAGKCEKIDAGDGQ
jgi:hypothetical protein